MYVCLLVTVLLSCFVSVYLLSCCIFDSYILALFLFYSLSIFSVFLARFFFFFNQKTAYEMRISDWSSDVCSSDLVIEILHLPVGLLPVQLSFALQFGDRCTIARRLVGIERDRLFPVLQASQGLAQEPLRCIGAAGRRQVEIDRVAPLVDCPVQVGPLAPHLDVGFIQEIGRAHV